MSQCPSNSFGWSKSPVQTRLTLAGEGIAMLNAKDELKEVRQNGRGVRQGWQMCEQQEIPPPFQVATRVCEWTNDEEGVARPGFRLDVDSENHKSLEPS